jgi:hypothetical protein
VARAMNPSDDQKVRLFRDSVYYEIIHTFGVPIELNDSQLDSHAIGEIINYSRHVHARALSHFLFRRASDSEVRKDDALAEDFCFDISALGLSENVRKQKAENLDLNKGLIHITYGRVTGVTKKPWNSPVLNDLLPVTIQFMQHIREKERSILSGGGELFTDQQERDGWEVLLTCLKQCKKENRLRFRSGFKGQNSWYIPSTEEGNILALYGTSTKWFLGCRT